MSELQLPDEVRATLEKLRAAGLRAWLVGGALRDALRGVHARDFDLVVEPSLERARAALPEALPIGAHRPILLLAGPGGGPRIEVSGLRGDARTLAEDLHLRDFTVNAVAYDASARDWIDPLGGRADLAARRLRACLPERTFRDDPVRVLRGVRLATELDLEVDAETEHAMTRDHWRLQAAPGERRREELYRLLALERATHGIEHLRRNGALVGVLPELLRGVGIAQGRHRDDVYRHSLAVCARLRRDPVLRLAALLHDVAKPETKGFGGRRGDVSFHRHEHVAAPHIERVASRLRLSKRDERTIAALVRHHLLFEERLQTDAAIRRMLSRVGSDILGALLELRRADLASRGPVAKSWLRCEQRIRELADEQRAARSTRPLAITGEDVKRELSIDEGPEIGRWLARARRRALEHPEENQRAKLLAWLRAAAKE